MPSSASIRSVRLVLIIFFAIASLYYISRSYSRLPIPPTADTFTPGGKELTKPPSQFPSSDNHLPFEDESILSPTGKPRQKGKMRAGFVSLIRNGELWEIVKSIRQIEDRFNRDYHYPWVFLNDVPFTEEFIDITSKLISGEVKYGIHSPSLPTKKPRPC